jgi:hypothetical protein
MNLAPRKRAPHRPPRAVVGAKSLAAAASPSPPPPPPPPSAQAAGLSPRGAGGGGLASTRELVKVARGSPRPAAVLSGSRRSDGGGALLGVARVAR